MKLPDLSRDIVLRVRSRKSFVGGKMKNSEPFLSEGERLVTEPVTAKMVRWFHMISHVRDCGEFMNCLNCKRAMNLGEEAMVVYSPRKSSKGKIAMWRYIFCSVDCQRQNKLAAMGRVKRREEQRKKYEKASPS